MKRLLAAVAVLVFTLIFAGLASAQSDPRLGTWKLNVAKSTFDPAAARTGETRTYKLVGDTIMAHVQIVTCNGSTREVSFNATPDGGDHPYAENPYGADAISVKRSGNGFTTENKKRGKVLSTATSTFSADGKVMTLTLKGINSDGQSVDSVRVYDKR